MPELVAPEFEPSSADLPSSERPVAARTAVAGAHVRIVGIGPWSESCVKDAIRVPSWIVVPCGLLKIGETYHRETWPVIDGPAIDVTVEARGVGGVPAALAVLRWTLAYATDAGWRCLSGEARTGVGGKATIRIDGGAARYFGGAGFGFGYIGLDLKRAGTVLAETGKDSGSPLARVWWYMDNFSTGGNRICGW